MCATWQERRPRAMLGDTDMPGAERSAAAGARARVLTVDDDAAFLVVLEALVAATAHLEIVGTAQSGERAVVAARELRPDVVLIDVRMPGMGGLQAAELIKAASRSTLIAMISTTHPDEIPLETFERFAAAVLWKSALDPRALDEIWLRHRFRLPG
jgi:DNA-binding NarL/FixJ family response regulator